MIHWPVPLFISVISIPQESVDWENPSLAPTIEEIERSSGI
jgi:hypothetical protein